MDLVAHPLRGPVPCEGAGIVGSVRPVVVVPTYQEAENIGPLLRGVREAIPSAHVVVLDDASPDGTGRMAEEIGAELGQVTVLHRTAKEGLGAAYREGFKLGPRPGIRRRDPDGLRPLPRSGIHPGVDRPSGCARAGAVRCGEPICPGDPPPTGLSTDAC